MKKAIALLLALMLVLAMTACNGTKEPPAPTAAPTAAPTEAPAPTAAPASTEAPAPTDAPAPSTEAPAPTDAPAPSTEAPKPTEEPDPNYGLINLYIPYEFVGDMTEEELRAEAAEMGIEEVYPQEDGGVVYVMTEETHQSILKEMADAIEETAKEITEGEEALASVRSVTYNDDYSNFVFEIDRELEDGNEGLYALSMTIAGAYYQAYSGAFEPACVVDLKDAATGEVYESVTYQDWLDFINSFSDWGEGGDWGEWESASPINTPELPDGPVVLLDDAGVTVTATGFEESLFGPVLNLHVVNTTDQLVYVGCDRFIINGYTGDAFLYTEVQPGSEADDTISIYDTSLDVLGTEYIGTMELRLNVSDDNYNQICEGDVVTIQTSDFGADWAKSLDGEVIFSEEGVTLKLVSVTRSDYWPATDFTLLVENASDKNVNLDISDMLVNGENVYPWFYETVYAGTSAVGVLSVDDENLGEGGVLESVEISITLYDDDTYDEIAKTEDFIALPVGLG